MKFTEYISLKEKDTVDLGRTMAKHLKPGDIVCLFGELGSGKTTLVKGIAKGLNINSVKVSSPTFVLLNIYEGRLPLYHFDLYRMDNRAEISTIGYEEFFYGKGISFIEWPERLGELLPKEYLAIRLSHRGETERAIEWEAVAGRRYTDLAQQLNSDLKKRK